MVWKDDLYVDATLPFGQRSALQIFSAVADAAEWIFQREGILHYLDDYLIMGPPGSSGCASAVSTILRVFEEYKTHPGGEI